MTTPDGGTTDTVVDQRYRLLERVGSGGMAEVWAAEDLQLGRRVALKLLYRRFAEDPEFVERFRREASAAAGLQHPNVVSVYDRGEWDGTYYIAMEFLAGRPLKDIVDGRPQPAFDSARTVAGLARTMSAAHKRGVVHRDLKPQNVILDSEGRVKVTDFGIARAGASDMTETGSIMGTAQYLSPEQAQGHAVSPSSDLYAIGIILFELLTGRLPFEGDSAVTIALKQVSEPPPIPSTLVPGIPGELEAIVLTAMAKDPAARFADADAFIAALEGCRERVVAGLAPPGDGTVAFGAVPAPGPGPSTGEEAVAPLPAEEEEAAGGKRKRWPWVVAALAVLLIAGGILAVLLTRTEQKPVPEVVGLSALIADQQLTEAGFEVRQVRAPNDSPKGEVFGQRPGAGEQLEEGGTVTINVSEGPQQVDVPDVAGQTEEEATTQLEEAGFNVTSEDEADDDVDEGKVIRTRPGAGQEVDEGSEVTIVVSSGPQQVAVPDVVGNTQEQAESALRADGFEVTVREEESTAGQAGTVIDQNPDGATQSSFGTTVTITVATEPPQVAVPDLTGRTESTARRALTGRGLQVDVNEEPVDDPTQDGRVIDQSPAGGEVDPGSSVSITVGVFEGATTTAPEDETP